MQVDYSQLELLQQQHERKLERMQRHYEEASEDIADALGRNYARYPWVNPEIIATLVLFGDESLIPQVGEQVAQETMRSGRTIHTARSEHLRKRTLPLRLRRV
jgi:hypothetical protein